MIADTTLRLATPRDAPAIAALSRDLIEYDLGWAWTPQRVLASMRRPDTNLVVAQHAGQVIGFAIMKYKDEEAYLHLFAVHPAHQRRGVGRAFYRTLGFTEFKHIPRMYRGVEDGVRIGKDLLLRS